ncbi:hypothetical protein PHMEG_00029202 [Phytophthora megakarya]|uniref:Integrase catalytic domain-containing protein n=1 Tax=Phytophthora megakarya TaxID=4795 RepID=A0A225V443_9STRA|nr:hypothetical protein PHMEG_00029202 [Phytophthora megakarya]
MTTSTLQQWHERLGHVNYQDLVRMIDKNLAEGIVASNRKVDFCMNCAESTHGLTSVSMSCAKASAPTDEPGATLCVDLNVDMTPDRLGHKHILTIVDHATNYNRVYLLRKKSEAEGHLEDFVSEFERQYDTNVKVIRSDGGGEFGSNRLHRFILNRGIRHQLTERDMSSSHGKAERFHRTVMDSARAMLWVSALPQRFWGDAVLYASYIRNYLPTRVNEDHTSPIEALTGKVPDVSHILRFGAKCTSHITHAAGKSAKKRAEKGVVIGIDPKKKAYQVYTTRTKRIISTTHIQNIERLDPRAVGRYMDTFNANHNNSEVESTETRYHQYMQSTENGDKLFDNENEDD